MMKLFSDAASYVTGRRYLDFFLLFHSLLSFFLLQKIIGIFYIPSHINWFHKKCQCCERWTLNKFFFIFSRLLKTNYQKSEPDEINFETVLLTPAFQS